MKRTILICLILVTAITGRAQLFSPESLNGALFGTMIGGIVGGGNGGCGNNFSSSGAAIGAGVGLVAGAIAGEARRNNQADSPGYAYYPASTVSVGYGYSRCGSSTYVYYSPNRYCAPGYYYQPARSYQTSQPARPNYAVGGTLLGAASGALIGQGYHNPGEGAAIGAGAGLVLGSIAEYSARKQPHKAAKVQTPPAIQPQPQAQTPQADASQRSENQVTSTQSPNSTYYWTSPPKQIADAPSVPDAPTF